VCFDENIPGKGFESLAILLHNGNSEVTGLARFDVRNGSRFAHMCSAYNFTMIAIL
jgi:hypothetical protein